MPTSTSVRLVASVVSGVGSAALMLGALGGPSSGARLPSVLFAGMALVIGAAAAWVALPVSHDERASVSRSGAHCRSCGGDLRPDWRLCPHCGELIAEELEAADPRIGSGDMVS